MQAKLKMLRFSAMKVSFYPIEKVEYGPHRGGAHDDDFDTSILPFHLTDRLAIEDISDLVPQMSSRLTRQVSGLGLMTSWAISSTQSSSLSSVFNQPGHRQEHVRAGDYAHFMADRSERISGSPAPATDYAVPGLFHGDMREDGKFIRLGFDSPIEFVNNPINQRNFGFRTRDAYDLKTYLPLFLLAMEGPFWKFRMAVQMHESAFFQNDDWRAKFFLYTTAVESLFTTQSKGGQHSGSLVATERIKHFLGANTAIYPLGELTSAYPLSGLTVKDVVNEIYCLRNTLRMVIELLRTTQRRREDQTSSAAI